MMLTYKGIVKGNVIQLEEQVALPEGTEVEVVVKKRQEAGEAAQGSPKGSPQALLAVFDTPPHCAPEDVDTLLRAIEEGKRPVRFQGIFDRENNGA